MFCDRYRSIFLPIAGVKGELVVVGTQGVLPPLRLVGEEGHRDRLVAGREHGRRHLSKQAPILRGICIYVCIHIYIYIYIHTCA